MTSVLLTMLLFVPMQAEGAAPQPGKRLGQTLEWEGAKRGYILYIPANYDPKKPTPVVLAFHGATMNGWMMEGFCGLNAKADKAGFIVVYPNGNGPTNVGLLWNAGMFPGPLAHGKADDVGFVNALLDELPNVVNVDPKRIYATGMSNGGMMTYRVGAELSHRIAAIAPVAGTIVTDTWQPKRPMPVLHMHGTADALVPFEGGKKDGPAFLRFPSVEENMKRCAKANGCDAETPQVVVLPMDKDQIKVERKDYGKGKNGVEVILYVMEGAGHIWPGRPIIGGLLGKTTYNLIANDIMWDFFSRYQREP